jgi:O-antigen/teichoic acid export membrane protein
VSRLANLNMSRGAALSLARLLSGVVRIKVVALAIGVGGVGFFALAQQVNLTAVSIVSMSLAVPMINLGRPPVAIGKFDKAGQVAGTALAILLTNVAVLLILSFVFGSTMVLRIGEGQIDPMLLWPLVTAIMFGALASGFWEGMSYLSDRFDIYVKAGIAAAIADMVLVAGGAWAGGLRGAIIAMPAGPLALFLSYSVLLGRDGVARQILGHLSAAKAQLPRLLTYSAMMFAAVALTNVGLTAARTSVLVHAGAAANGNLQAATSLSAYILAFVTTGFWGHVHARAAAAGDTAEVRAEFNHALEGGLLISFTGCGTAAVLADYLLPLFYSHQFSGAAPLVIAYMPGELCFQFLTLLISYQLTLSLRRRYLAWSLGYIALLVATAAIAVPRYGAGGYVAGHIAASALMVAVAGFICWRGGQIRAQIIGLAASLLLVLAGTSTALLVFREEAGRWVLIALFPFLISGSIVARQFLHGAGLSASARSAAER